jgi:hypothetical protein
VAQRFVTMSDLAQSVLIDGLLNNVTERPSLRNNRTPGGLNFGQYTGLTCCGNETASPVLCQPVTTKSVASLILIVFTNVGNKNATD